jgi:hypothetical protein
LRDTKRWFCDRLTISLQRDLDAGQSKAILHSNACQIIKAVRVAPNQGVGTRLHHQLHQTAGQPSYCQKKCNLQSAILQETRATVINRQSVAKGKTNSQERNKELEAIAKRGERDKSETKLYKHGTEPWFKGLREVPEGEGG